MPRIRDIIARMQGYVPGEQPRDRHYVKLNTNENPYPPSPHVTAALRALDPARLRLYPDPVGQELRRRAAACLGLTQDWVLCGNGSDDLLTIAVRTFVDQGGSLAFPSPSYSLYPVLAELQGAVPRAIDLDDSFELPPDAAARAGNATLFFVARPNAPTGNAFPLEAMHRVCRSFDGIVWIDEAYADFADDNCAAFVQSYDNVVVSRTLSKSYSLAGVRFGIAYAHPQLIAEMLKVKDSYNVNAITQAVALAALQDEPYMRENARRIRETRTWTVTHLEALGFTVLPSAANFVFARPPQPIPARTVFAQLREHGILVRHFAQPRVDAFIRITIGSRKEMQQFIAAAAAIIG